MFSPIFQLQEAKEAGKMLKATGNLWTPKIPMEKWKVFEGLKIMEQNILKMKVVGLHGSCMLGTEIKFLIFSLGSVCIVLKGSKNKRWQLDYTKQFEWTGGVRVVTPYFANHST